MSKDTQPIRELFIEELEEVIGGSDNKIIDWLRDQLQTTYACGEESPC